jgi:uncharacterized protein (TIGR03437 family)
MCKKATVWIIAASVLTTAAVRGQNPPSWRRIGNTSIDLPVAGRASGPVDRIAYSADGAILRIRTASGHVFETSDFETWNEASPGAISRQTAAVGGAIRLPEIPSQVLAPAQTSRRLYAFGKYVYRSDNSGASWENLTQYGASSIVGDGLRDLAVSPANEEEIAAATSAGVFRSLDGGKSWSGLNQGLPNLPAMRLLSLPSGDQGVRLALADGTVVEWAPGEKQAWLPVAGSSVIDELRLRQALSAELEGPVTAVESSGGFLYAGMSGGRLSVSADGGLTWRNFTANEGGAIERFWVDPANPQAALAVLGERPDDPASPSAAPRVLRTENGGVFWDDLTANLPGVAAHGISADHTTGAIYVATDRGVFMTYADLQGLGAPQPWTALPGLPQSPATDVKLDAQGNQLWAALEGFGVYSTLAPHRLRDPRVVSSADFVARAAAPGSLVSVLGARVQAAQAGDLAAPVLAASDAESQIQIPFEARGSSLSLAVDAPGGRKILPAVPLETAAPAIFVDHDGSPLLLDAATGVLLDAMTPAHSRSHIQILATGLGRVKPEWPTGLAAPVENPPQVAGTVTAYLDRQPVEVTSAVLAPYVGFYLVEIEIPKIIDYGPAELYIQMDSQTSNRVRVYIEP